MKQRRHQLEQIIGELAEGEKLFGQGQLIKEVAGHLEVTESTQHRWRNQYGGMRAKGAKRLGELEKEYQRRKRIVVDQALDIDMVGELNRGNF
jgi:putative transposase